MVEPFVGNPIMLRMRDALLKDNRIDEVFMLRCHQPFMVRKKLRDLAKKVDVIHVHFGGMYALLTWILLIGINKPKFITFHGTDIHAKAAKTSKSWKERLRITLNQKTSFLSILVYDKCGFVAKEMMSYVPICMSKQLEIKSFVHSLGVDYQLFMLIDKNLAQEKLNLEFGKYALFSDVHNTTIKRRDIAEAIIKNLKGEYRLLIMCGVNPKEVPLYVNACDFVLLTSDEEGSPNIIREALSLNKPVFSVDVGDAVQQLKGLSNSSIISRTPKEAAKKIMESMSLVYTDNTRDKMSSKLDFVECNKIVVNMYQRQL